MPPRDSLLPCLCCMRECFSWGPVAGGGARLEPLRLGGWTAPPRAACVAADRLLRDQRLAVLLSSAASGSLQHKGGYNKSGLKGRAVICCVFCLQKWGGNQLGWLGFHGPEQARSHKRHALSTFSQGSTSIEMGWRHRRHLHAEALLFSPVPSSS